MDRFKLKLLMVLFMVLDSIRFFFDGAPFWFTYVGRVVMPIFFYLLVEGYFKTSSKNNYQKRLLVAAEIMFIGNLILSVLILKGVDGNNLMYSNFNLLSYVVSLLVLIFMATILVITLKSKIISDKMAAIIIFLIVCGGYILRYAFYNKVYIMPNNMFLALSAGFIMLNGLVEFRGKDFKKAFVKVLVGTSLGIFTESLILGPAFVFIFYKCFNNRRDMYLAIFVFSALFFPGFNIEALLKYPQWMIIFTIPFIYIYNGKKGKDFRWFFYVFYPLQLWILYLLSVLI